MELTLGLGLIKELLRFLNFSERKARQADFNEIKNTVLNTSLENDLCLQLKRLKTFFNRYPEHLKKKENQHFFQQWLIDPNVDSPLWGVGLWSNEKILNMRNDLEKVKL